MFSALHLGLILVTVLIMAVSIRYFFPNRSSTEPWLILITLVVVLLDPLYWVWEIKSFGSLNMATTLPIYLCSLFWLQLPFAVFGKGRLRQITQANIATVGLLCGILGFVFNVHLSVHGVLSFVGLRSLLYHFLMIFVSCYFWVSGYYEPKREDHIHSFIPVLLLLVPCFILYRAFGFDYGYMAGGIGTPFEMLSSRLPRGLFLLVLYGGFYLVNRTLFYRHVTDKKISLSDLT